MSKNQGAYIEIATDDQQLKIQSVGGSRKEAIKLLETTAHTLRVAEELVRLQENLDVAKVKARKTAMLVNQNLYVCDCGEAFATQNGYAGHQNHCGVNGE